MTDVCVLDSSLHCANAEGVPSENSQGHSLLQVITRSFGGVISVTDVCVLDSSLHCANAICTPNSIYNNDISF